MDKIVGSGITFDDVLVLPARSDIVPRDANVRTRFSRGISVNVPICSAAMDTVTESSLAIALAQEGGIGVIHKNLSIQQQAIEVDKVKRSESGVIFDPITLPPSETIGRAKQIMADHAISGIPILDGDNLVGILTIRDLRFFKEAEHGRRIADVMTKDNLVTAPPGTTLETAKDMLHSRKVEKLLLVDDNNRLKGLITIKDINKTLQFPEASKDERGRLRVGAAVGVRDLDRVKALMEAGVDVVVVDTAHGHSTGVLDTVRKIKEDFGVQTVAGNVATEEGARDIAKAGADAVKVGIGPGSICTTRIIAGIGVPQISAVANCARAAAEFDIPVIADGGIRHSGDVVKALVAGASCVMIGGLFAGLEESPGESMFYQGRRFKTYRGMGSLGAMVDGSSDRYRQESRGKSDKLVPEGVEGRVPYRGTLAEYVYQLVGGVRAGMGYTGCHTIAELQERARFIQISGASLVESHPHHISITREAPNYWMDAPDGPAR